MDYIYHYDSPLGPMTLGSDGRALTGLWFDGEKYFGEGLGRDCEEKDLPAFAETVRWLDIYFTGKDPGFLPPLAENVTPFRMEVREIMLQIPFGETVTYGRIAEEIAGRHGRQRMSAQAVGGAVGHNPISIIVPCHRVVGSNGSLSGYAGGIDKKIRLLELEGADMTGLFVPGRGTAL